MDRSRSKILAYYQEKARDAGLTEDRAAPLNAEPIAMTQHRAGNIRLFAYTTYVVRQFLQEYPHKFIYALFDREGYMLQIFAPDGLLHKAREAGLLSKTIWTQETTGPNAVSIGLSEDIQFTTTGEENYADVLKQYAIYFSPISLQDNDPPYHLLESGGIAVFVPVEEADPEYKMIAFSVANLVMANLHFLICSTSLYERQSEALMILDIDQDTQKVTVNHHSSKLFDILGIYPMDIDFRPAKDFVDPYPANTEFWDIIEKRRRTRDLELTLTIHGQARPCIVSTHIHNQPKLNLVSILFSITSSKQISSELAQMMGNNAQYTFQNIVGDSPAMRATKERAKILSQTFSNIMLLGESGVGKDIFAQAIHNAGPRSNKPFIAVNCGALPRDLIASDLFGYSGGAFTGAKRTGNIGKFELANGGTIFLDEIGELPLDIQATLLRVVEQKNFMPVGGNKTIKLDLRVITATNVDILAMIEQKRFRADLYYRLSTMWLEIPPLRERKEDILLLANYFIRKVSERVKRMPMILSDEAQKLLMSLFWPGNVRELQNLIEIIVQLYPDSVIYPKHIEENIYLSPQKAAPYPPRDSVFLGGRRKRELLTEQEILDVLQQCGGNRSEAARRLGIARKTLYRNMERLGMLL